MLASGKIAITGREILTNFSRNKTANLVFRCTILESQTAQGNKEMEKCDGLGSIVVKAWPFCQWQ